MAVTVDKISNAAVTMSGSDAMTTSFLEGVAENAEVEYGYESVILPSIEGPTRLTGKKVGAIKLTNIVYRGAAGEAPSGVLGTVAEPAAVITIAVNGTSYPNCLRSGGSVAISEIMPRIYGAFGSLSFAIYDDQT